MYVRLLRAFILCFYNFDADFCTVRYLCRSLCGDSPCIDRRVAAVTNSDAELMWKTAV